MEKEYNTFVEMKDIGIGISGLGVGPFPDRSRIGPLVKQWRLLPLAKMLGFDEEEITVALKTLYDLGSDMTLDGFVKKARSVAPYVRDGALAIATSFESPNEDKNNEDRAAPSERTMDEKMADVVALFSALCAYVSSVERIGQDEANGFSLKVLEQLRDLPPEVLLNNSAFLAQLQEESPSRFSERLYHYPNDHSDKDDESSLSNLTVLFAHLCRGNPDPLIEWLKQHSSVQNNGANSLGSAIVHIPGEHKTMSCVDFLGALVNQSIKPQLFIVTAPEKPRQVRATSRADLHDAGCYLEAVAVSLLIDKKDFITKGINLNIAQEEGLAIMDGKYAEIGGEQRFGESVAQGYLDKRSEGILKASILDGKALAKAEEALNTLKTVMSTYKTESTKVLKETEKMDRLTKPVSLDTEVEDEEGGSTPLAELIPAKKDLNEALGQYSEVVSKLPQDIQPIFRRVWDEGETPKQAAINLGHEWTSALERKIERAIKKTCKEMLN